MSSAVGVSAKQEETASLDSTTTTGDLSGDVPAEPTIPVEASFTDAAAAAAADATNNPAARPAAQPTYQALTAADVAAAHAQEGGVGADVSTGDRAGAGTEQQARGRQHCKRCCQRCSSSSSSSSKGRLSRLQRSGSNGGGFSSCSSSNSSSNFSSSSSSSSSPSGRSRSPRGTPTDGAQAQLLMQLQAEQNAAAVHQAAAAANPLLANAPASAALMGQMGQFCPPANQPPPQAAQGQGGAEEFTCTVCRKVFKRAANLIFHMTEHRPAAPGEAANNAAAQNPLLTDDVRPSHCMHAPSAPHRSPPSISSPI